MPQDPPERVHAAARRPGLPVPGAGRAQQRPGRQQHQHHQRQRGVVAGLVLDVDVNVIPVVAPAAHARVQAVRRVLALHARGDGEEGGDPYLVGYRHRRLRRRERRARQHTRCLQG